MSQQEGPNFDEKTRRLQSLVIEELLPAFAQSAKVLYSEENSKNPEFLGNTKHEELGLDAIYTSYSQFPSIILFDQKKDWLYLIEATTDHGHLNDKRKRELEKMFGQTKADLIFITAFLSKSSFCEVADDIAWETEVWIAENPKHMIHFNGDRFMGPR